MNVGTLLLLVGGGILAASALGKKKQGIVYAEGILLDPPVSKGPPPPPKPNTPSGSTSLGKGSGRAWFYVPIDRNAEREGEQLVATIDAFGEGEILADVYEQIEPPGDVAWPEDTACGVTRWRLRFENGIMISAEDTSAIGVPKCFAGARPISKAYLRDVAWVQRGPDVYFKLHTLSGMVKNGTRRLPWGPGSKCVPNGQCDRWDNDWVESGEVLVDVVWKSVG